jgi:hypothetical protein
MNASADACKKISHATRDEAILHLKNLVWTNEARGNSHRSARLDVYPCDRCDSWHVGHQPSVPLVWHYTIGTMLDSIVASGELRPRRPRKLTAKRLRHMSPAARKRARRIWSEQEPLRWFSRCKNWEPSVMKIAPSRPFPPNPPPGRFWDELHGGGLVRFGVFASVATLRWGDFLKRNPMPIGIRDALTRRGDPREWLATDQAVPLDQCRALEVYYRGAWVAAEDLENGTFDRYLEERLDVYNKAWNTLLEKLGGLEQVASDKIPMPRESLTEAEAILYDDLQQVRRERGVRWVRRFV